MKTVRQFDGVAALMYAVLGAGFACQQVLVSSMTLAFDATPTEKGWMVGAIYAGTMGMVLVFGEIAERIGKRMCAVATAGVVALGALLLFFSRTAGMAVAGFALYGAGFGGFENCVASLISDKGGERAHRTINLMEALFSTGAVLSPLLISALLKPDEYKPAFAVLIAVFATAGVYFMADRAIDTFAVREVNEGGIRIFRLVRRPRMLLYMAAMILYSGTETIVTYWIPGYFDSEGIGTLGAAAISTFWAAAIAGRLIASRARRAEQTPGPSFALAAAGTLLLIFLPGATGKMSAIALVGLGFGPLYGSLSAMGGRILPENAAAGFSLMIFSSGLGGTLFQPVISSFVQAESQRGAYFMTAGICLVMAVVMTFAARKENIRS